MAEAVADALPVMVMVVVQGVEAAEDPAKVGSPVGSGAVSEVAVALGEEASVVVLPEEGALGDGAEPLEEPPVEPPDEAPPE